MANIVCRWDLGTAIALRAAIALKAPTLDRELPRQAHGNLEQQVNPV